jgi:preprotein translocase subunit SecF
MEEKEKKNIQDKEKKIEDKEKEIASDIKAEAEQIDKSLSEVIREQATEDEAPLSRTFSLRKILGGDILSTSFMRRQIWLCLLIALFIVVYIANRYSCQQDIIEIDALQKELKDAKYKALSSNSKLTEESRQSNVLDMLKNNKDSTLKLPTQPPYIITVPDK